MYGEYLKQSGLDVEEAADGRLALAKALSIRPDIVVTETRLFGIDGYDLCQLLRRDATTVGIPIVVVTADAYQREGERERSGAADVVLLKPCLPNVLLSEIRGLIQRSRDLRRQSEELRARLATQLTRPRALHGGLVEKRRRTPARVYDHLSTTLPELVPLLDGKRENIVIGAMRAILEHRQIIVNDLRLPQAELRALSVMLPRASAS
jgi:DNA-binding response OmpR family regulator